MGGLLRRCAGDGGSRAHGCRGLGRLWELCGGDAFGHDSHFLAEGGETTADACYDCDGLSTLLFMLS